MKIIWVYFNDLYCTFFYTENGMYTYILRGCFMSKFKVLDFDYGCGGFTKGLEDSNFFEVIYNGFINEKNSLCYNNIHKNSFSREDLMEKDVDLVVFTPDLGQNLFGIGSSNFFQNQLDNCTALVSLYDFDNVIFITQRDAIPLLHYSNKVFLTSDGVPTKDIICCRLLDSGYNVFNFVLDGAGFGLAQHRFYNIYWASKVVDESIYIKEGFGIHKRPYRTVQNVIGDIKDDSDLSWHNPDYKREYNCSLIEPGSNANQTEELNLRTGYIRLEADKMAPSLLSDFYNVSSKGPSVNPWYNRPLTIREGARLFGLTDDFVWDFKLHRKEVAMMIYEAFPPVISQLLAHKIKKVIKNK